VKKTAVMRLAVQTEAFRSGGVDTFTFVVDGLGVVGCVVVVMA
jgi:hypothetical protein